MSGTEPADRLVVSYPPGVDDWVPAELAGSTFVAYLHRAHGGPVAAGDAWEEFVSRGCGDPLDLTLRVEAVEGGDALGPDTSVEFVPRTG